MLKTFAERATEELFRTGKTKRVPVDMARRALKDDRAGQHSILVNHQWRICFRFVDGDAHDVEFFDYQ